MFLIFFLLQSDVIHQSVYELVHSEDREELQRQLGILRFDFEYYINVIFF